MRRPDLWATAVRVGWRALPRRWWSARPLVRPRPDDAWVTFRNQTAMGGSGAVPPPAAEFVAYLEWCRTWDEADGYR